MDGLSHIELLLVSAVSLWPDHLVEKGDAMREDVTQHEDGLDLPHPQLGRKNVIEPCARLHVAECDESVHSRANLILHGQVPSHVESVGALRPGHSPHCRELEKVLTERGSASLRHVMKVVEREVRRHAADERPCVLHHGSSGRRDLGRGSFHHGCFVADHQRSSAKLW